MTNDAFLPLTGLALVMVSLVACISRPEPRVQAQLSRTAWYEEQVEEGFGHLDRLRAK